MQICNFYMQVLRMSVADQVIKKATFAMGCFWGSDALFGCVPGVLRTRVGYSGGLTKNPTYHNLGDHTEAVDIDYDPQTVAYDQLLSLFWDNHDPTVSHKIQYMSVIFYHDDEQLKSATSTRDELQKKLSKPVVTKILPFNVFYNAEGYHQKYFLQTFHKNLTKSLNITEKDLIPSSLAAKLNSYVTGHGTVDLFNAECSKLGLSSDLADYVRVQIKNPKNLSC